MALEAAINGWADPIVTFNRKDYGDVATQFGIEVLPPAVAIKRIRR